MLAKSGRVCVHKAVPKSRGRSVTFSSLSLALVAGNNRGLFHYLALACIASRLQRMKTFQRFKTQMSTQVNTKIFFALGLLSAVRSSLFPVHVPVRCVKRSQAKYGPFGGIWFVHSLVGFKGVIPLQGPSDAVGTAGTLALRFSAMENIPVAGLFQLTKKSKLGKRAGYKN